MLEAAANPSAEEELLSEAKEWLFADVGVEASRQAILDKKQKGKRRMKP